MLSRSLILGVSITILAIGATATLSWLLCAMGGIALGHGAALAIYGLTETGGSSLVAFVIILAIIVWATDAGSARDRRRKEAFVMLLIMVLVLPAVAAVNEHIVKPAFATPRPSHQRLSEVGIIPDLDAFYRLDTDGRQEFLISRSSGDNASEAVALLNIHAVVLDHWIHETGYTFPSGHAFNVFIMAVLFLGGALANPTPRRRWLAGLIMSWAIAVALSRVLLLVHRPLDVSAGALAGAVVGAVLLIPWWLSTQPPESLSSRYRRIN